MFTSDSESVLFSYKRKGSAGDVVLMVRVWLMDNPCSKDMLGSLSIDKKGT